MDFNIRKGLDIQLGLGFETESLANSYLLHWQESQPETLF